MRKITTRITLVFDVSENVILDISDEKYDPQCFITAAKDVITELFVEYSPKIIHSGFQRIN